MEKTYFVTNVRELIEALQKVEDKEKPLIFRDFLGDLSSTFEEPLEVNDYLSGVELK